MKRGLQESLPLDQTVIILEDQLELAPEEQCRTQRKHFLSRLYCVSSSQKEFKVYRCRSYSLKVRAMPPTQCGQGKDDPTPTSRIPICALAFKNTTAVLCSHGGESANICCIRGWSESFTVANMPPLHQSRKSYTPTHVPTVGKLRTRDCWLIIPPVWTVYLGDYCRWKATQTAKELLKFPTVIRRTERRDAWVPSWVFRRDVLHSHRSAESCLH